MKRICLIISIFALALAGCKKDTAPQPSLESDNIIVYGKIYTAETASDKTPADKSLSVPANHDIYQLRLEEKQDRII
ncbi:MAG: hypothetical protein MJZ78_06220 [Bacteroidales bacterium]|nr:hypothetical protein [Bacteroidales bacterium]